MKVKKAKKEKSYSKKLLVLIIVAIIGYTIAAFALQFFTQVEISPTLTTAYYAFWSVEIINLTSIKKAKVKKKNTDDESDV